MFVRKLENPLVSAPFRSLQSDPLKKILILVYPVYNSILFVKNK